MLSKNLVVMCYATTIVLKKCFSIKNAIIINNQPQETRQVTQVTLVAN